MTRAWLTSLGLLLPLAAGFAACTSSPRPTGVDQVQRVRQDDLFLGSWRSTSGRSLRVAAAADGRYRLTLAAEGRSNVYGASLLRIEGYLVAEVLLNRDEIERSTDANNVPPVYLYTLLDLAENQFSSHHLLAGWVRTQAEPAGIRTVEPPAETQALATPGSGRLVVAASDRDHMYALLRRAVQDPSAWAAPELFLRTAD